MDAQITDSRSARWGTCSTWVDQADGYTAGMALHDRIIEHLTRLKMRMLRIVFAARHKEDINGLLGVVGTAATLAFPDRPRWVRVEQVASELTTRATLVLPEGLTLVPERLPDSEPLARRWLHRLVAAEAARREVDEITAGPPARDRDWIRAADAFLAKFRDVHEPSALARAVLHEELTREVQVRFYFMVRRLRKARNQLMERGFLTNRDLEELWARYRYCDADALDAEALEEQSLLPERLRPTISIEP